MEPAKKVWERALGELQIQISKANYVTWLSNSQGISYQDNVFVVSVPNIFVAEWLSQRLHSLVRKTLANIMGRDIDIQFIVHNPEHLQAAPTTYTNQTDGGTSSKATQNILNPKYTFDNFTVGDCNRLAYAAAVEVAENQGRIYNPLFIHSTTSQGKTHLLHAIGHAATNNGFRVAYTTAEQFTNEFVSSVKRKQAEDFQSKFKNIHTFLFDDIQFLSGKKQTLQCFLYIFNELYNNNHQLVITADCDPKDMASLSTKLRSRLQWGLVVPIHPPDSETCLAILRAKAKALATPQSDKVLQIIAEQAHENVRQLEGALAYLSAQAKLSGVDITPQFVNNLLTNSPHNRDTKLILQTVANHFELTIEELIGKKRDKTTTLARQITMYLMREETSHSFAKIGKDLGNRNHATVLHGYEKIACELNINRNLHEQVSGIKEKVNLQRASKETF